MPATVKVLIEGFLHRGGEEGAGSTISLVLDGDIVMVVDPGFVKDKQMIIDALEAENLSPDDVTIVCITHSHIDHYANMGMFPKAAVLEYYGIWSNDGRMVNWKGQLTENIQIVKTPGHDETGITLFVKTSDGIVAICGDVFWKENYPEVDYYATNIKKLDSSRKLVADMSHWIIPGHGSMYKTHQGEGLQKAKNGKSIVVGRVQGSCKKCHRPFVRSRDKCLCQQWLCYRCCECDMDCNVCRCKHRRF